MENTAASSEIAKSSSLPLHAGEGDMRPKRRKVEAQHKTSGGK
jgi:hypothetical protein